jgi:hypothetical protein
MADFASDLKQRFIWAMDLSLESYEVLADGKSFVRSDQDERAIGIFENLGNSVDDISPKLIEAAEAFRSRLPDAFERTLSRALQAVGIEPDPETAADFVEALLQSADRQLRDSLVPTAPSASVEPSRRRFHDQGSSKQ